jgi:hypothetical protein
MTMGIAALVIYQVVTLSGGNIFQLDGSGLCSKVLGILNFPAPLAELPVHSGHHVTGSGDATVETNKELSRSINCQPTQRPADSLVVAGDCIALLQPGTAIREQFLCAVLEDCSFFAHLVLRFVRGGEGSAPGVAVPREFMPLSNSRIGPGTQRVTRLSADQELQNLPPGTTETSFPELETLWMEVACRSMQISVCEGGRS